VHCIVTGGALSADGTQWHAARPNFLFHANVMRKLFRGKFLDGLQKANVQGRLLRPDGSPWLEPPDLRRLLRKLRRMKWVVYCKRPFGGPEQVIKYLGRYTHRVAISNRRLLSFDADGVAFKTRDGQTATLEPVEFLRRFVQHVLPAGFVKIRHYGLLANGNAHRRWNTARALIDARCPTNTDPETAATDEPNKPKDWQAMLLERTGIDVRKCPACGQMTVVHRPLESCRAPPIAEAA
jgi:hypothetical protein